ncbi:hypothetical protein N7541_004303 [Penicillium brevicompactum]|uniref:Maltose/galactoside acetyltransferase domain-containing protein n=1 Tax=Penicillium brevicompactum TaxID=5074 RepID=A0A9W9UVQ4_PENBR|nr:hypothetical protein N7541_004303 [Penicillium brevicompactum]
MASTEREKMLRGELYCAFTPDLIAARTRCKWACNRFNRTDEAPRRQLVELWKDITEDNTPLPPPLDDPVADAALLEREPWIEAPVKVDYGFNVKLGEGVFINFNCVFIDTCPIIVGARTLFGPSVHIYSGTHPLDPALRNGLQGPESGEPVVIGEDCWLAGNVTVLPGITIGRGCTIGAGSVVTKDVPAFHVAAGNPAKIIRRIQTTMTE